MSKSIAELRTSPRVGLPQRSYELCLASTLVAEVQSLLADLEVAMETEAAQSEGNEQAAKPKRMADGSRSREIRARLGELRGEMAEHTGTLTLKGVDDGRWREWVDAHPPREGNDRDATVAFGICNAVFTLESG